MSKTLTLYFHMPNDGLSAAELAAELPEVLDTVGPAVDKVTHLPARERV